MISPVGAATVTVVNVDAAVTDLLSKSCALSLL